MVRSRKRAVDKQINEENALIPAADATSNKNQHSQTGPDSSNMEGNGVLESNLSPIELQYKHMYMQLEEKAEELMLQKIRLSRELHHARGDVMKYENMLADLGTTLGKTLPTDAVAAPEAAASLEKVKSLTVKKKNSKKNKNQVAPSEVRDSRRTKRKNKKV